MKNILSTAILEIEMAIISFTGFEKWGEVELEVKIRLFSNRLLPHVSDTPYQIP